MDISHEDIVCWDLQFASATDIATKVGWKIYITKRIVAKYAMGTEIGFFVHHQYSERSEQSARLLQRHRKAGFSIWSEIET